MVSADTRPRFVKIVRTRIAKFLATSHVVYEPTTPEQHVAGLRAKLVEEAVEYLLDPSIDELADVLEVVRSLAIVDLRCGIWAVEEKRGDKWEERGGFEEGVAMYVTTTLDRSVHG